MPRNDRPEQMFDIRLVERHIAQGITNRKDYEQYLRQLQDMKENAEVMPKNLFFNLPEGETAGSTEADKPAE